MLAILALIVSSSAQALVVSSSAQCDRSTFSTSVDDYQCMNLHNASAAKSADECAQACCNEGPSCEGVCS
jgi:hypothetical protein